MIGKKMKRVILAWLGLGMVFFGSIASYAGELWRDILLGHEIQSHGIELIANPDGLWQATELGGQTCIEMQPNLVSKRASLYFAVDDTYIFNNAYDVLLTVEYFDRGIGFLTLEFDDGAQPYRQAAKFTLTNKKQWLKTTINLSQVGFTNGQANGADFRLTIADTALGLPAVRHVYVWRAPGPFIAPRHADFSGESFSSDDDLLFTYYFYWYDIYSGMHIWDNAEHTDDALQDHPATLEDFSFKSVAWHKRELRDLIAAKIDVILPIYWGSAQEMATWSVEGLEKLVQAGQELLAEGINPPKIGLFFDTSTLQYGEYVLRSENTPTDLNTTFGRAFFFKQIRDFFSLVPPALWARIDGKPVVWLYAAAFTKNANQALVYYVNNRFAAAFPSQRPFIVREVSWNMQTDRDYAWGAALNGAQINGVAGVGPGYNDSAVPGRTTPIRDREEGDFYRRNWEQVLGAGRHLAVVETWNELHEGTDICNSREYGRQYIEITAEYATKFKQTTKFFGFEPQRWAGALQPTCSLSVQNRKIGIRLESAACAYSEDRGETWHPWPATCTGVTDPKAVAQITAHQIPFTQNATMAGTPNYVRFSIENTAGDTAVSPAFAVFNGRPPDYFASISLGAQPQSRGLVQSFHQNDDGWSAATTIGGVPCSYNLVANPSPYPGRYLYFNVADTLVFAGSHPEAWIEIEYYDTSATNRIELQYDSQGTELAQKYKAGGSITTTNTRGWKTASFVITDVYFGNRQNGFSDFRFITSGVMFLASVSVSNREEMGVEPLPRKDRTGLPAAALLAQNYPNPFNQTTRIRFELSEPGPVHLTIFDIQGRRVQTLARREFAAGSHQVMWDGCNQTGAAVTSGVYLCALEAGASRQIRRLVLLR